MRTTLLLWLVFLVALCLAPVHIKHHLKTTGRLHDVGHVLAFFITSALLLWQARRWHFRLALTPVALFIACATEYMESAVYHNQFEWGDVRRDSVGILLGFIFATLRMEAVQTGIHADESQLTAIPIPD